MIRKPLWASKTVWGIAVMALSVLAEKFLAREVTPADEAALLAILEQYGPEVGAAIGAALAIYGRVRARGPIGR